MKPTKKNLAGWREAVNFYGDELESIADPAQDLDPPEPNYRREAQLEVLRKALQGDRLKRVLSERQAELVRLKICGMKIGEIAKVLGLSKRTCVEHLRVARTKLKSYLEHTVVVLEDK